MRLARFSNVRFTYGNADLVTKRLLRAIVYLLGMIWLVAVIKAPRSLPTTSKQGVRTADYSRLDIGKLGMISDKMSDAQTE
jgi:hypothetical protein